MIDALRALPGNSVAELLLVRLALADDPDAEVAAITDDLIRAQRRITEVASALLAALR